MAGSLLTGCRSGALQVCAPAGQCLQPARKWDWALLCTRWRLDPHPAALHQPGGRFKGCTEVSVHSSRPQVLLEQAPHHAAGRCADSPLSAVSMHSDAGRCAHHGVYLYLVPSPNICQLATVRWCSHLLLWPFTSNLACNVAPYIVQVNLRPLLVLSAWFSQGWGPATAAHCELFAIAQAETKEHLMLTSLAAHHGEQPSAYMHPTIAAPFSANVG